MMSKKGLVAGIFSAALVLSLGITPGVAADISEPVENARAEGSINSVSSDDNKQRTEIPQDWVPVDTEQAREALQKAEQKLAEFPAGLRAHENAVTGEMWVQFPTSGGSGTGTPDGSSGSLPIADFGHAGIVTCDESRCGEETIEAYPWFASPTGQDGVRHYTNNWKKGNRNHFVLLGAKNSNRSKRAGAANFAEAQVGKPYSVFASKTDYSSFYCSKLVWAAWRSQGHDFDSNGGAWVLPMDLVNSYGTVILWARM
ncbi:hypothetical protein HMPREF9278_1914 [Mobiluncus mulieris FB024-16]|nr:hypothetical protein HMPREF9278_1914 [Mobiluncus mulieris FB024-16]